MNSASRPWVPFVLIAVLCAIGMTGLAVVYRDWQRGHTVTGPEQPAARSAIPVAVQVEVDTAGMAREDAEQDVAVPLEEALRAAVGVDRIVTRVEDGRVIVSAYFSGIRDPARAVELVRGRLATAAPVLPSGAIPVLAPSPAASRPLFWLALHSRDRSLTELSKLANRLARPRLLRLPDIRAVLVAGGAEHRLRIDLDPDRLRARDLTASEVIDALQKFGLDAPAGNVRPSPPGAGVRIIVDPRTPDDWRRLPLKGRPDGSVIHLADVATVEEGIAPRGQALLDGRDVVALGVSLADGADASAVRELLLQMRAELPKDVRLEPALDPMTSADGCVVRADLRFPTKLSEEEVGRRLARVTERVRSALGAARVRLLALSSVPADDSLLGPAVLVRLPASNDTAKELQALRAALADEPELHARLRSYSTACQPDLARAPMEIALVGPDFGVLARWGSQLRDQLTDGKLMTNADANIPDSVPEVTVHVDRHRAASMGVDVSQIAAVLRGTQLTDHGGRVDVRIALARTPVERFKELCVRGGDGRLVPLESVAKATIVSTWGPFRRIDGQRAVVLSGEAAMDAVPDRARRAVIELAETVAHDLKLPDTYRVVPIDP